MRTLLGRGAAFALLLVGLAVVAPGEAGAASCSTTSSHEVDGGYQVTIYCPSVGFIDAFGTTLTDANIEALQLYQLYAPYLLDCTGTSSGETSGHPGYLVRLHCNQTGFIEAYGTTLTDAAREARELATLHPTRGLDCTGLSSRELRQGGFEVTLYCPSVGFVEGQGSTLSGASLVARLSIG